MNSAIEVGNVLYLNYFCKQIHIIISAWGPLTLHAMVGFPSREIIAGKLESM